MDLHIFVRGIVWSPFLNFIELDIKMSVCHGICKPIYLWIFHVFRTTWSELVLTGPQWPLLRENASNLLVLTGPQWATVKGEC